MLYKDYIKRQFQGRKVRFTSNCIVPLDITGVVVDTDNSGSEIIYIIDVGGRIVRIGENTPKLSFDFL